MQDLNLYRLSGGKLVDSRSLSARVATDILVPAGAKLIAGDSYLM